MRSITTISESSDGQGLGRLIPRPDIPVQPVLSWGAFSSHSTRITPAVVDEGRVIDLTSGRIAIAHALELAGVQRGDKVLVPAYHCISMVEPIIEVGAQPIFYALRDDLSSDLDDIEAKLDGKTRVLMAVNYFGFPQDLPALRRFCDDHGLTFIEDCAHSFFGSCAGKALGSFGDFAIASLSKFFPVREGGCLVIRADRNGNVPVHLRSQGFVANVGTFVDMVEDAVMLGRLRAFKPAVTLSHFAKRIIRKAAPTAGTRFSENPGLKRSGQSGGFDPSWMGIRATMVSRLIAHCAARDRIVENRRANYARLVQGFSDLSHCRPLLPRLPAQVVPYMFPLWVDSLRESFASLEDLAVPMQRFGQFLWPGMNPETCAFAMQLSGHLIQLPCHQGLTEEEMATLVDRVRRVVA